eukprot:6215143-Prymnesium_polylepis.1
MKRSLEMRTRRGRVRVRVRAAAWDMKRSLEMRTRSSLVPRFSFSNLKAASMVSAGTCSTPRDGRGEW